MLGASFKAAPAQVAAFDAVANSEGGTSLAYPLTIGAAPNRAIAVFTHIGTSCGNAQPGVSGVTFDGSPLLQLLTHSIPTCPQTNAAMWALPPGVQPAPGTHDVVVTLTGRMFSAGSLHSGAFAAAGVDQASTFTSFAVDSGLNTLAAVTLPVSGPNDLVVDSLCSGDSIGNTPQTLQWRKNQTNFISCDNSAGATADGGTTSLLWSTLINDYWMFLGASFRAASLDAGVDAGSPDAGEDAGGTDSGVDAGDADAGTVAALTVGCGCTSGDLGLLGALALIAAALARRPRPLT
jgi:hypothetical protein